MTDDTTLRVERLVDASADALFHAWSGTTVTFALEPRGDKTLLVLVHENFPSTERRNDAATGWPGFLDRIERLVASIDVAAE